MGVTYELVGYVGFYFRAASRKMNKLTMADLKFLFDLDPKRAPNSNTNQPGASQPTAVARPPVGAQPVIDLR